MDEMRHRRQQPVSNSIAFGRLFVKRLVLCYRAVVCLSVTLVCCGQTAGWIKMPLGKEVTLGPGDIVLNGDPAPLERGTVPPPPTFRPMSIVAKRLDRSRYHLVRR